MLKARIHFKKGTFTVIVQSIDSTQPTRPVFNCKTQVGNTPVEFVMFFNKDPENAVFGTPPGRAYSVTGIISGAQFMGGKLHITMNTCHLAGKS